MNWLSLVPYLLAAAVAAGATWPLARAPLQGDIADLRTKNTELREAHAESARLAAQAASARLQTAQQTGEAISARLAKVLSKNDQLTEEKKHALKEATVGRACLSERALRVLNGSAGITVATGGSGVPAATGQPAGESGAAATDTDVAGWIVVAGKRHEACREQLGALIDWINTNDTLQEPKQ
jgi:prophage endopeptidase